jgi:arginyl-tRNA synthetase
VNEIKTIKSELTEMLREGLARAQEQGKIPVVPIPESTLERPQRTEHGDYASSLPLKLARATAQNPLALAHEIVAFIPKSPRVESVAVAPPGFINFTLKDTWLTAQVATILNEGDAFGNSAEGKRTRVQIEFVSVNPTGPLHVGHGRGAVLGSTLANVLAASGYTIEKEYYINDAGNQIDAFYRSLLARYLQCFNIDAEIPPNGYHGTYMIDLAKEIITAEDNRFVAIPKEEAVVQLGEIGLNRMVREIHADCERLGVNFDCWFSEKSLYSGGQYQKVMALLKEKGFIAEKEGAVWFVSTALGEDKDNVVVRSDGTPTYFASDIAYHYNKFCERNFDRVIDIWGADHQGHVPRMKAAVSSIGLNADRFKVIIAQLVTLKRGNEVVKISKRSGELITLREVMDEVGTDACRYFFLSRSADSQMDFDLELAKKESQENPVYYIQYAHARTASILKLAAEKGLTFDDGDISLLTSPPELTLIRKMLLFPELIETVTRTLGPHHLPFYALDLATAFSGFYRDCRCISDDAALTKARLKMVLAARTVLSKTLRLMEMNAPDSM